MPRNWWEPYETAYAAGARMHVTGYQVIPTCQCWECLPGLEGVW